MGDRGNLGDRVVFREVRGGLRAIDKGEDPEAGQNSDNEEEIFNHGGIVTK